jgi:hypothetical protein
MPKQVRHDNPQKEPKNKKHPDFSECFLSVELDASGCVIAKEKRLKQSTLAMTG